MNAVRVKVIEQIWFRGAVVPVGTVMEVSNEDAQRLKEHFQLLASSVEKNKQVQTPPVDKMVRAQKTKTKKRGTKS